MKQQIVFIRWWETFNRRQDYVEYLKAKEYNPYKEEHKRWTKSFKEDYEAKWYEVFSLSMPLKYDAKYLEWEIWFNKLVPYLKDGVIFVWYSLWAVFLIKYLNINKIDIKVSKLISVSAPFTWNSEYALNDFDMKWVIWENRNSLTDIILIHSADDFVVPYLDVDQYSKLILNATIVRFDNRNHFLQEDFNELTEIINS